MKVIETAIYVGPNLYAPARAIRLRLALGELVDWPTGRLGETFTRRLLAQLPGLRELPATDGSGVGFAAQLVTGAGIGLAALLLQVLRELQRLAGEITGPGAACDTGTPGEYDVIFGYLTQDISLRAVQLALDGLNEFLPDGLRTRGARGAGPGFGFFDFRRALDEFLAFARLHGIDLNSRNLVAAAESCGIPWQPMLEDTGPGFVQLGQGARQERLYRTYTGRTSSLGTQLADSKSLTSQMLRSAGLPVPAQRLARTTQQAVLHAGDIGFPVVIKPQSQGKGQGVTVGVTDPAGVRVAFARACAEAETAVVVEACIAGEDHRLLVVRGELIAAARRIPACITGNGVDTIEALVDAVNRDPRRGIGYEKVLERLSLDAETDRLLAVSGYSRTSVLADGEQVALRGTANISTGGTAVDVLDRVHPDNRNLAIRAAATLGLDVAGIDFITTDIARSYRDVGGAICEVNQCPGLRPHLVAEHRGSSVAQRFVKRLFPEGTSARIPLAAITGTNGKTTTARMLAHILRQAGYTVGLACTDGIYVNGTTIATGDASGPGPARVVLRDPTVNAAVLEVARGGVLRWGLGFDRCDVAGVLNVTSDHLGIDGVQTLEQMARVKRVVAEAAMHSAVLNADDPLCVAMAGHLCAAHLCYVTMNTANPTVEQHLSAGGTALRLEDGTNGRMMALWQQGKCIPLIDVAAVPATHDGRVAHNVQNALFAAALAHGLGLDPGRIRDALASFECSFESTPGRLNIHDGHPFRVVLDYGHNIAGLTSMCDWLQHENVSGRRLCLLGASSNRRDADYPLLGKAIAGCFDHYVLRDPVEPGGRCAGDVPRMIRAGLLAAGVEEGSIRVVSTESEALVTVLDMAGPGDLIVVFGKELVACWQQIVSYRATGTAGIGADSGNSVYGVPRQANEP